MRLVLLGLRMSLGSGRSGLLRTALMSSGAALGALVVLACLAAVSVSGAQLDRARDRAPVFAADDSGYSSPVDGGTRYVDPDAPAGPPAPRLIEIDDAIGHTPLRRIAVGGVTPGLEVPPGIARLPAPGEAVVSPALAALIRTDARARERFPQRIVGTIGRAGLVAPNELRAYVGVEADDPALLAQRPLVGFGGPVRYSRGDNVRDPDVFTPGRYAAAAFALFVLVPFGIFLATCARLSASTRDRRIASLRLLGLSARQTAVVNAVETGVVATGGALLGTMAFLLVGPRSTGWAVGRLQWFGADVSVAPAAVGIVLAGTVAFAVAVGVLAARAARVDPLGVRRGAPARRPHWWRVVPMPVGLAGAVVAGAGDDLPGSVRAFLLIGSLAMTGLGLALAVPVLGYGVAGVLRRMPGLPVWLDLAAARLRHSPGVAPRLVASLTVSIYVAGVGALGIGAVTFDQAGMSGEPGSRARMYQVLDPRPGLAADLRRVPGIDVSALGHLTVQAGRAEISASVGYCADIVVFYGLGPGESCVDGQVYRTELVNLGPGGGSSHDLPRDGAVLLPNGATVPIPSATLHLSPRFGAAVGTAMLITRGVPALDGAEVEESGFFVVAADLAAADRAARLVSATAPASYLEGDLGGHRGIDGNFLLLMLTAGLTVTFVLGVGSFAAAAVDRTMERRRDNATLAVVGTRPAVVTAGETGFGALPLAIGLVLASAATVTVAVSFASALEVPGRYVMERLAPVLWLAAGALVVGVVLIAVPARLTQRITAEQLRRP